MCSSKVVITAEELNNRPFHIGIQTGISGTKKHCDNRGSDS
jgi:hypothetical protein